MLLTRTTRIQSRPKSPQDASSNPYLPPWYIALPCSNGQIDNLSMVKILFALRAVHHSWGIGRPTNMGREYTLHNLRYIMRLIFILVNVEKFFGRACVPAVYYPRRGSYSQSCMTSHTHPFQRPRTLHVSPMCLTSMVTLWA
jgi:hypothetical protein